MSIEMPYEIINLSSSHRIKTKVILLIFVDCLTKYLLYCLNKIKHIWL